MVAENQSFGFDLTHEQPANLMKNTVNRLWKPFVSRMGRDKIPPAIGALLLAGAMVARADVAATNAVAGGLAATNAELWICRACPSSN